jgi:hypothetical protein
MACFSRKIIGYYGSGEVILHSSSALKNIFASGFGRYSGRKFRRKRSAKAKPQGAHTRHARAGIFYVSLVFLRLPNPHF